VENENMLRELKTDFYKEIDELKRKHQSLKKRISVISNLFIPGIGFLIYGVSYLKGFISLSLFILYNYLYFNKILPLTGEMFFSVLYYIPAIVIWLVSTVIVSGLDD
jgi:hypothetical protein